MSTTQVRRNLALATTKITRDPVLWFGAGTTQILLVWSQDLVPFLGTFVASVLWAFVNARVFARGPEDARVIARDVPRRQPLIGIGLLHIPLTAVWPVLFSFHQNAGWLETFSLAWTLPLLFLLAIGEITLFGAVGRIVHGDGVDRALATTWQLMAKRWREVFLFAVLVCFVFTVCFLVGGWSFALVVPFALATAKEFFRTA